MIERGEFAEALGHLEDRVTGNAMRSEVVRLLSPSPEPDSLRLHRALLKVSRNPSGMHLVTTNYDDNFARASSWDNLHFHSGPMLPDLDNWNSVVHLHGRIQDSVEEPAIPPLVLTKRRLRIGVPRQEVGLRVRISPHGPLYGRVRWIQHGGRSH